MTPRTNPPESTRSPESTSRKPRLRLVFAVALVALLTIPAGVAYAGQRSSAQLAAETGTSIFQASSTTAAPSTAAPTIAPSTTEAPTTTAAPPVTEAPTTAPPATEAPTTTTPPTTAAPAPTAPPTTKAPVAPPTTAAPTYVRTYPTASPEEWEKAKAFAHIVKTQQDEARAAAAAAAAAANPGAPAPEAVPEAPAPTDDPLQQLSIYDQQFFQCVRWRESRGNYGAVNSSSGAGGAYQLLQSTWNNTVVHMGRGDLIGMRPNYASVHDQDMVAVHLLQWYGRSPWAGPGC